MDTIMINGHLENSNNETTQVVKQKKTADMKQYMRDYMKHYYKAHKTEYIDKLNKYNYFKRKFQSIQLQLSLDDFEKYTAEKCNTIYLYRFNEMKIAADPELSEFILSLDVKQGI